MSLATCFQRAVQLGILNPDEGRELRRRYNDMLKDGISNTEARDRMARHIQAEADLRERAALKTHIILDGLLSAMENYRDFKGRKDEATAFLNMHENMGQAAGSFIQDAQGLSDSIARLAMKDMKDVMREMRRGAFTGDLRRTRGSVKAMADDMVREIMGVDTGNARAKILAKAWMEIAEKLRVRFNEAGGAIGKLAGGYIPQSHDRLALLAFGKTPWVDHMMEKGRLDRKRMLDQSTGEMLTDSQLRHALEVSWERITTDGYYDMDIASATQGKGALYTQHMDHRFIHFASPEHAMEYSKRFGNGGDVYASMMSHIQIMSRDIAHMEVFGPNPNRTREFLKQHLRAQAARSKSNAVVIAEQTAKLKELTEAMNRDDPAYLALLDRHAEIVRDIDKLRSSLDHNSYMIETQIKPRDDLGPKAQRYRDSYESAIAELQAVQDKLNTYQRGDADTTVTNPAAEAEFRFLLDHMREAITVAPHKPGDLAIGWVNAKIRHAEARWDQMRGGEVGNPVWAARMSSVRNVISAAALGSAVFSSLTDPAWGQDMRLRMGMGMKQSNFMRIAMVNIREMITMGSREDAIASGLGIDSGLRVLHKHAKEAAGWDHRFWSAYLADRVLTTGMLLPWTQAGKHMFGLDAFRYFAKLADHDWSALPEGLRKMMVANGIDQRGWAQLRVIPKHEGMWLRPTEVIDADRQLGERYLQMVLRAQRHAIPEATIASSTLIDTGPAGTLKGELLRSMLQFKGFAFAMLMLHPLRIARELGAGDARGSVAAYAATMFITSTMLGMVALALKDIKDGKDPRKWLDEKTWLDPFYVGEAILQSGGLGIFGDFIRSSDNRMGGGLAGTIAGPLAGKVENVSRVVFPQVSKYLRGKEITSEEELVRLMRSGTVPFSNHVLLAAWYQRAVMDQVQKMADPRAYASFARKESEALRERGQAYYWRPGQTSADRLPDLTRPFATR